MIVVSCPACEDSVSVPLFVSTDATLRCPLCHEEIAGRELVKQLPPAMEVVSDPGGTPLVPVSSTTLSAPAAEHELHAEESEPAYALATPSIGSDDQPPPAFDFEESEAPQREAPNFGTSSTRRSAARRRDQGNSLITMLSIVTGGLAAFPLAQLCIWWLFANDPVNIGPKVADYVPFVVPRQFRGLEGDDDSFSSDEMNEEENSRSSGDRQSNSRTGRRPPTGGRGEPRSPDLSSSGSIDREQTPDPEHSLRVDGAVGSNYDSSPNEALALNDPDSNPLFAGLANPTKQLLSLQETSKADIDALLPLVLAGIDTWEQERSGTTEQRSEALDKLYQDLCLLGNQLTYLDPNVRESHDAASSVVLSLERTLANDKFRSFLANRAARLLDQPWEESASSPSSTGIAMTGTLMSIERRKGYLVSQIQLADTQRRHIQVIGWLPPPQNYQPGAQVTLFGSKFHRAESVFGEIAANESDVLAAALVILDNASKQGN